MTNYLLYNYYYRYREFRKQIKNQLVDTGNYTQAKTELDTLLAEHESKFPDSDVRRDFNYGEKIMMRHALGHLNSVIDYNNPSFFNSSNGTIGHHSDIVKSALVYTPKSDYRDMD